MKILFFIITLFTINNGCAQQHINQDSITVEYSAMSRGLYKVIKINKKTITYASLREVAPIIKLCDDTNWDYILQALKQINIENLPNLKAPSENRLFDGAAIGKLKITYEGKTYETPSFDHGNPHHEIAELVKEMLSISENIE
ncbi:hypothetical protein [Mariniflexile sp. AS56]|uniref:hypothetical protein n=1 Tax=Mariniflexile sp. AS56 TaxID=3063957 RepID=UPI0026F02FE6|nr:hypothetical protein [Mariniflexile sp. AS56]MDO7171024.1 hypothetical protein [Mariniflexile sp. AS56]